MEHETVSHTGVMSDDELAEVAGGAKFNMVALNPQPIPPGRINLAALNPQPLPPGPINLVGLNPQPLPPNPCRIPGCPGPVF